MHDQCLYEHIESDTLIGLSVILIFKTLEVQLNDGRSSCIVQLAVFHKPSRVLTKVLTKEKHL